MARNSPLPPALLPFLQQEYLQAALQDNGAQLPRAKSPVALTNVVSTEQETLCSHIRVKYLLFISAKARGWKKEQKKRGKRKAAKEKVRVIKTDGWWGLSCRLWGHCETFHDNQAARFSTIWCYVPIKNITCQIRNSTVRGCSCVMTCSLTQRWIAHAMLCSSTERSLKQFQNRLFPITKKYTNKGHICADGSAIQIMRQAVHHNHFCINHQILVKASSSEFFVFVSTYAVFYFIYTHAVSAVVESVKNEWDNI